jgi:hypothetical protein
LALFRAGHAHAGVWLILSLVIQALLDAAKLPSSTKWLARRAQSYRRIDTRYAANETGAEFAILPSKGRGGASRRVVYAFSAKSDREYRAAALLCEELPYYSVKEGDAIEVRYLKSDPTVNMLPSEVRNEPPPFVFFLFMPIFFLAIFGAMFWPPIGEVLKARRWFKNGRIASGRVIFIKKRASFL